MTHRTAAAICLAQLALSGRAMGQAWVETCDDIQVMTAAGWVFINHSSPLGTTGWFQGNPEAFPPQEGTGYIASDFTCGAGVATQSNWALSPVRTLYNGDRFYFETRTLFAPATYPDRLQVRLSTAGASANIGSSATDVGDFTTLLFDVNPAYTANGYPRDWEFRQASNISGLPAAGAQCRFALRYFVENGGPDGTRGTLIGVDNIQLYSQGPLGACCLIDSSCALRTQSSCTNSGGVYQGGNVTCEATVCPVGACCFVDGSCATTTQAFCTNSSGVYQGTNVTCGTAGCPAPAFVEIADAGDRPTTATVISGVAGTTLPSLGGHLDQSTADRADMFRITICDRAAFSATGTNSNLYLFDLAGVGIVRSQLVGGVQVISNNLAPTEGDYYLACSFSPIYPTDSTQIPIWLTSSSAPSGSAANHPLRFWLGGTAPDKRYRVAFTGVCYVGGSCAANCDLSTNPPILNANDFLCFMNQFAAGDIRANCDHSTTPPTLNANDFACFLNEFAHCL